MTLPNQKQAFDTTDLVEFLKANPDVFQHHPELLQLITLSDERGASSLLEKQLSQLKERISRYQSQQFELIEVARENEQISDSFSRIICQLIGFQNLSEFASEFPSSLRKTFEIDEVSIKTQKSVELREDEKQVYSDTLRRLANNKALCDDRWPNSILQLFFSSEIKSAALIPMRTNDSSKIIGLLALGSTDATRYTNELGTDHLNRLGIMAGICLARLQLS